MKGSESEWSNQKKENSISYEKILVGKKKKSMEMIGILPRYNTMKCEMPATSNVWYLTR